MATTLDRPARNDLSAFWMPFTANRQFKRSPRLLVSAHGMHFRADDGREILDGIAGLWCVNAGHGRRAIADAAHEQLSTLDFAPVFQMGHPLAFEAAARLAGIAPEGLDHVFFTNSGSEAVDTALKIALAYHRARGDAGRTRLIGRQRGYHGTNLGGTSVGGMVGNRIAFGPGLPGVDHLPHTHLPANRFSALQPPHGAELADALDELVGLHGPTIAAVIVEPVAGSTGVLLPPQGYLERLRAACDRHGILLIFDEVITGFGRIGAPFAAQRFGVTPDMITCAKGLTNGSLPMGAVIAAAHVHDTIVDAAPEGAIELFHGYTYSAHPVAAAVAIAALNIYEDEGLLTRAAQVESEWSDSLHSLRNCPGVVDIRSMGLVGAVELEPEPGKPGKRAYDVFLRCYEAGVLVRQTGDTIALSPPLIIERPHIDQIVATLRTALTA